MKMEDADYLVPRVLVSNLAISVLMIDTLRRALASAEIPAKLEPTGMSCDDGRCPDGILMNYSN